MGHSPRKIFSSVVVNEEFDDWCKGFMGCGQHLSRSGNTYKIFFNYSYPDYNTDSATMITFFEDVINRRIQETSNFLNAKIRAIEAKIDRVRGKPRKGKRNNVSRLIDQANRFRRRLDQLDEITAAQVTSGAKKILYGAIVEAHLKVDTIMRKMTKVTKSDVSASAPLADTTRNSYKMLAKELFVHPLSDLVSDFWVCLIQLHAPEPVSGYEGSYFIPGYSGVVAATLATEWGLVEAERDCVNMFNILGVPLRPLDWENTIETLSIFSYYSGRAFVYLQCLAVKDDATQTDPEFDASDPEYIAWIAPMGVPPDVSLAPLLRCNSAAATPGFLKLETPAANKLSILYVDVNDTAWTWLPDTSKVLNDFKNIAAITSGDWCGPLSAALATGYVCGRAAGKASASDWNATAQSFLSKHFNGKMPKTPALCHPLADDKIPFKVEDGCYIVKTLHSDTTPVNMETRQYALAHLAIGGKR
jgi:hypothetical protein